MHDTTLGPAPRTPWYREPWPWILMAGPVAAVLGGAVTAWLAVTHQDGLVADDYYKRGLAINRTLERERAASALGVKASAVFSPAGDAVRVYVDGLPPGAAGLSLKLAHATVAGHDRVVPLERNAGGWFDGRFQAVEPGKWKVLLEDSGGRWRVTGLWLPAAEGTIELGVEP
ncbi:MAG: FixH family protein [Betaproteobacteria bacterium]